MGRIEWAMWANEHGVLTSVIAIVGAIVSFVIYVDNSNMLITTAISLVMALLVLCVEWPRGKRRKGRTQPRPGQKIFSKGGAALGCLTENYILRFILHLLAAAPCVFQLSTAVAGVSFIISAVIYLAAALCGESWSPIPEESGKQQNIAQVPSAPPPRDGRVAVQDVQVHVERDVPDSADATSGRKQNAAGGVQPKRGKKTPEHFVTTAPPTQPPPRRTFLKPSGLGE